MGFKPEMSVEETSIEPPCRT